MKKYRIVVKSMNSRHPLDTLDFKSYKKFNEKFDQLASLVLNKREGVIKVDKYLGKELIETVSL